MNTKHIFEHFRERVLSGERFTLDKIIEEFYEHMESARARENASALLYRTKRSLAQDGVPLLPVSPDEIGIPKTKDDSKYAFEFLSRRIQFYMLFANLLHGFAEQKHILPEGLHVKELRVPTLRLPSGV